MSPFTTATITATVTTTPPRELASDLSPDLVRDFDERWWQAAKKVRQASAHSAALCALIPPHFLLTQRGVVVAYAYSKPPTLASKL